MVLLSSLHYVRRAYAIPLVEEEIHFSFVTSISALDYAIVVINRGDCNYFYYRRKTKIWYQLIVLL